MKRIRPRLLTAEIMLCVMRLAVRTTTGVWPFRCIGTADLVLIGDPGLVAPVDRRPLGLGAFGDRRVVLLQPGRDRRGRPFPGPRQRLLRGHVPALQVELHRRQAERLAEAQRDQVAHRAAGPQGERQLQLVGRPVADPALDLGRLVRRQQPLAPARRHPPPVQHAVVTLRAVALQPDVHRLPLHPDHPRRLRLAHPLLQDQHQRPPAQFLLRRPPNAAKVPLVHAQSIAGRKPLVRYIYGILVVMSRSGRSDPDAGTASGIRGERTIRQIRS